MKPYYFILWGAESYAWTGSRTHARRKAMEHRTVIRVCKGANRVAVDMLLTTSGLSRPMMELLSVPVDAQS